MRGRPRLKKQKQKQADSINHAPRRRNFSTMSKSIELNNKELARHNVNEISDLNEIPDLKEELQSCYNHRHIDEIHVMFHPYITIYKM
uniref:Uncharacterized protein n=1 Tax=Lactuca sativa TaxID=4236 RepID=A0A9R1VIM7_LACSA|nr:hypothetical protein LSAT_V11C500246440 [Lactuca sativa]